MGKFAVGAGAGFLDEAPVPRLWRRPAGRADPRLAARRPRVGGADRALVEAGYA